MLLAMMYIQTVIVFEDYNKCVFLIDELTSDKVVGVFICNILT